MKKTLLVVAVWLFAASAFAQAPIAPTLRFASVGTITPQGSDTIVVNTRFAVLADVPTQNVPVTGYRLYRNGAVIATVATAPSGLITFEQAAGWPTAGQYTVVVAAFNNDGEGLSLPLTLTVTSGQPPPACSDKIDNDKDGLIDLADPGCIGAADNDEANPPPQPLPAPWVARDIGAPNPVGSSSFASGTFTLRAGGLLWESADALHFVAQPMTGDFDIVARVGSLVDSDPWAKAGVMIRATDTAGSVNAFFGATPGNGWTFQRRLATGGPTTGSGTARPPGTAPGWVKLTRRGNVVASYFSTDGVTWTVVLSDTVTMPATVNVGLAIASDGSGSNPTATMSDVSVTASTLQLPACNDKLDNDGDKLIDFGTGPSNDPGCTSATDTDETNAPPPAVCTYTLVPTTVPALAAGGSVSAMLTASASTCTWTAAASGSWLTVVANGTGGGTLSMTAAANTTTVARSAVVVVRDVVTPTNIASVTVTQVGVSQPPPPGALAAVSSATKCRITVSDVSPFTSGGGSVRFRFNNADGSFTNIGSTDGVAPYQQVTNDVVLGTYSVSAVWSKTGNAIVTRAPVQVVCRP